MQIALLKAEIVTARSTSTTAVNTREFDRLRDTVTRSVSGPALAALPAKETERSAPNFYWTGHCRGVSRKLDYLTGSP